MQQRQQSQGCLMRMYRLVGGPTSEQGSLLLNWEGAAGEPFGRPAGGEAFGWIDQDQPVPPGVSEELPQHAEPTTPGPGKGGRQMSVQLVFPDDDDDYILFDDKMLDTFIKRRRVSLGVDGYWEIVPAVPEAWIAAAASEGAGIWMKPDMLLSLDEFVVAAGRWRNQ